MAFVFECVKIILSRWRRNPLLIALIVLNIACGLSILTFFVNMSANMSAYMEREFFSSERIRHIIVKPAPGSDSLPQDSAFVSDTLLDGPRVYYGLKLPAELRDAPEDGEPALFSLSVLVSPDAVFDGENGFGSPFISVAPGTDWREGLVVSRRAAGRFPGQDPLGALISFEFAGREMRLPVTAVLGGAAEECYDMDCFSDLYFFAPEGMTAGMSPLLADLRVPLMEDVEKFIAKHEFMGCQVLANTSEVNQMIALSTSSSLVLGSCGVLFAVFCSAGISGSLTLLQEKAKRSSALFSALGFTGEQIILADVLEGLMLSAAAAVPGIGTVIFLARFPGILPSFRFAFIDASLMSELNIGAVLGCNAGFLALVAFCRLKASSSARRAGYFDTARNER